MFVEKEEALRESTNAIMASQEELDAAASKIQGLTRGYQSRKSADDTNAFASTLAAAQPLPGDAGRGTRQSRLADVHPDDMLFLDLKTMTQVFQEHLLWGKINLPAPVVMLVGSTAKLGNPVAERVNNLFSSGIAVAAAVSSAIVIDGGLKNDVGAAEPTAAVRPFLHLIGISAAKGRYDASPLLRWGHNQHIVVRCSAKQMPIVRLKLAQIIVGEQCRGVVVVAAGMPEESIVLLKAVQLGWAIVVIAGSGGLAEKVIDAKQGNSNDRELKKIANYGNTFVFQEGLGPEDLRSMIRMHIMITSAMTVGTPDDVLEEKLRASGASWSTRG